MWNDLNLTNPIHDICEYGNRKKDVDVIESLPDLVSTLTSSAEILTQDHPIWEEIKIFKNIQTKYKRILHCDKSLQYLQKVGTCLRKMVLLNISTIYLDLAHKVIIELQNKKSDTYFLPSCQQLEYVLIRTQAAAKLICESLHYSREAFCYLIQRLKVGHLIINLMMATSVTARLNIVMKGLLVQLYTAYRKLYTWRKRLRRGGYEWPKTLDLPEDLEYWISLEDSEFMMPKHLPKKELDFLTTIFGKNTTSESRDQEVPFLNASVPPNEEECMILDDKDDGVFVERSELENMEPVLEITDSELEITNPELEVMEHKETDSVESLEIPSSSTDPEAVVVKKDQKLSKAQKKLLKKVKGAKDIKELKNIWENLDLSAPNLLPHAMSPENIRHVDKMFLKVKRKMTELRKSKMPEDEKKNEIDFIVKISRLKFAKTLGFFPSKEKIKRKSEVALKPVHTFKELKELYATLYQKLQTAQEYKKCAKLKKLFKSRRADVKLLVESGEKKEAKQLIFNTSKLFINYL